MMLYDNFFDDVFNSVFNDTFDSSFGSTFKAPKLIKSMTDNSFPQSNVFINKDTKECKITVCLPGVSKDECFLSGDDNVIVLKITKKREENSSWEKLQNGFNPIEDAKLSWKIDTSKYDLDTLKADFENGLMTIIIEPTEVAKPKKRVFFGNPDVKTLDDKSSKDK